MKTNNIRDRIYEKIKANEDNFFKSKDDIKTLPLNDKFGETFNGSDMILFNIFATLTMSLLMLVPITYLHTFILSLIGHDSSSFGIVDIIISTFTGINIAVNCLWLPIKLVSKWNHKKMSKIYAASSEEEKRRIIKFLYKDSWLSDSLDFEMLNLIKIYLTPQEYTSFMLSYENDLTYKNLQTFIQEIEKVRTIQEKQKEVVFDIQIQNNIIKQQDEQYSYANYK